jgi:hypothetical protein
MRVWSIKEVGTFHTSWWPRTSEADHQRGIVRHTERSLLALHKTDEGSVSAGLIAVATFLLSAARFLWALIQHGQI